MSESTRKYKPLNAQNNGRKHDVLVKEVIPRKAYAVSTAGFLIRCSLSASRFRIQQTGKHYMLVMKSEYMR